MSEYPISQDLKALTEERDYFRGQYHAKLVRESQLLDDLIKTTKNLETELESVLSLQGQVKSLEAQNTRLREALEDVLIGGNHLASAMLSECPPTNFKDYQAALKAQGQPYADMWAAWDAIMKARAAIAQAKEQG